MEVDAKILTRAACSLLAGSDGGEISPSATPSPPSLVVVRYQHESDNLLRPARSKYISQSGQPAEERPCVCANRCLGATSRISGWEKVPANSRILREMLTEHEDLQLRQSGVHPPEHRMCVLCERAKVAELVAGAREPGLPGSNRNVVNWYCNIEGDGEYSRSFLLDGSSGDRNRSMVGRVAIFVPELLAWNISDETGEPYIDQSRMKCTSALVSDQLFGQARAVE